MTRPTREQVLLETAYLWARRSTCSRLNVGCVIAKNGRILTQGYNGAPAGLPHCNHECTCALPPAIQLTGFKHMASCNSQQPCTTAVHAEQNAIAFAARWGVGLEGTELYCTHQPCLSCAMSIINAGIETVYYAEPYRLRDGVDVLEQAGILVIDLSDKVVR